jgi:hypothetical protein
MNSASSTQHHPPWWKERMVWLIIGLPLSAVVAGLATFYIAVHNADDIVKDEYVKTGMAVEAPRERLQQAAKMGLAATLSYNGGKLEMRLLKQGPQADTLFLTLVHPTRAELDTQITLTSVGQGKYQARVELTGQGKRHLILEPPGHTWRLEGNWHAPFDEEASLQAGAQYLSTHP